MVRSADSRESTGHAGDWGSIPGLWRSPGEGNGNPFQYSCLVNSMDRNKTASLIWPWTVWLTKSQRPLSTKQQQSEDNTMSLQKRVLFRNPNKIRHRVIDKSPLCYGHPRSLCADGSCFLQRWGAQVSSRAKLGVDSPSSWARYFHFLSLSSPSNT